MGKGSSAEFKLLLYSRISLQTRSPANIDTDGGWYSIVINHKCLSSLKYEA